MSHLKFYSYEGLGTSNLETYAYNQSAKASPACATERNETNIGIGGWDPKTGVVHSDINAQIDQAFANVQLALTDAGGQGWEQVYRVNSYHIQLDDEAKQAMVRNFKKWLPNHKPLWTCVGVPRLGEDSMRVEIEVVAHDPDGAKSST
ncbi:endoribonuclease L-PSP [Thelonectria olida]|uniref:Endoribonuclease L-PSP n=1 Tax=Thelonectria olida TaxID=1576542 RepID=A0A9P8WMJ7_9HYPO|nr:endoribonuclease L-PSP [Thelonectria olida]